MKVLRVIISVLLSCVSLLGTDGIGRFMPHLAVVPDMVRIGLEYIDLDVNTDAPGKKELQSALEAAQDAHPFVLAGKDRFDEVRAEYKSGAGSDYTAALTNYVLQNAEALLDETACPPIPYELDEENSILPISRETINRMVVLGFAWQVTGDERFAARAWRELENVCAYPDWRAEHFLAAAEMALAVSIGYDWFYDALTDAQRNTLAETTLKYAVEPALSKNLLKNWFTWSKNNWNSICYSGVGIACMTFWESFPQ